MTMILRFRHRLAAILWGFAAVWFAMLLLMTVALHRGVPTGGHSFESVLAVLLLFWALGAGLLAYAASKPCFTVSVDASACVRVVWLYPFRIIRRAFTKENLTPARVVRDTDSDGDDYFTVRVSSVDGDTFDLQENHDRQTAEQTCAQFNRVVFGDGNAT